jgi:hypothetical protein
MKGLWWVLGGLRLPDTHYFFFPTSAISREFEKPGINVFTYIHRWFIMAGSTFLFRPLKEY